MSDDSAAPMKPQDTVIFLLGELKGQVGSLKGSVDSSAASQSLVNIANEQEHAKFRQTLSTHDSALAVIADQTKTRSQDKLSTLQKVAIWIAAPSSLASLIGLLLIHFSK